MKITKEKLNLSDGLNKEWIITNGIGGFASSTILGANTRKYHGLLIAPFTPPARRFLILSKLDESLEIENRKYDFYTNIGKNYISEGFKFEQSFEKEYFPIFTYKIQDTIITKSICMRYGRNTVGILYKIKNGNYDANLKLAPILNFRDFHTMSTNKNFEINQEIRNNKVKIIIDRNIETPIYMNLSEGQYTEHKNDIFYNMFYIEEEKRGFFPEENHVVSGVYNVPIKPNEEKEISFVCSLEENIEEISVNEIIKREKARINKLVKETKLLEEQKLDKEKQEFIKDMIVASDNFIVYRPSFTLHTIIAGYPWFLDWGRDSLISFEGLLLKTKRFDIAKEVLKTYIRDIKFGLVPNGYSGFDNRPLYNSADSSLLLFEQVQKYLEYTQDTEFVEEKIYPKLEQIIENYQKGIDVDNNNIYVDSDDLLVSGTDKTQNTWMDAKYGDFAATPRNGKAVEINSLWYNSLMIISDLSNKFGKTKESKKYKELADKCKLSFNDKFYNAKRKCLYDVLGDSKIRPNQLCSLSLTYPVIDPDSEIAENIINTVDKKLLNNYGLKTLAKGEKNYIEVYEGDNFKRDMSYHQGITWPWLLGIYYNSLKNMLKFAKTKSKKEKIQKRIDEFKNTTYTTFKAELFAEGCLGNIAEIYDSKKPQLPKGAIAQAWSVAEVFRITLE